jgi:lysozyme
MRINQQGIELIKEFEGLRLKSYKDAVGIWTIGYGSTGKDIGPNLIWTEQQCLDRLRHNVEEFERAIERLVTVNLTENQFSALVCFVYNVGAGNFKSSTMLKLINKSDFAGAAIQFLRWNKAGGKVLDGLTRRRQAEKDLFEKEEITELCTTAMTTSTEASSQITQPQKSTNPTKKLTMLESIVRVLKRLLGMG